VTDAYIRHDPRTPIALVLDSPHSGEWYPDDFDHLPPREIVRRAEDTHVARLWRDAVEHGATLLEARFPRAYIDANRSLEDIDADLLSDPWPGPVAPSRETAQGIGLVWRLARGGTPMYGRKLTSAEKDIDAITSKAYQVGESMARPGDVLVAVSSSGRSPNIVRALAWAESHGMQTIAMTGFAGGEARTTAGVSIHVDADNYGGARAAVEHLIGLGRKRIAAITGQVDTNVTDVRLRETESCQPRHDHRQWGPGEVPLRRPRFVVPPHTTVTRGSRNP